MTEFARDILGRFSSLGRRSTRRYSTTTVQPIVRTVVGSVLSLRRSIRRRRYSTADIIDEPEVSSRKESMASSNLSRDDFPIVCITEATEVCHTLSKGTTPKKLDSPTSDDSCVDSMFSSKESSLVLDDMKTRVSEIAIELACLSPLPMRKAPAKPPRLHSRRSSLAVCSPLGVSLGASLGVSHDVHTQHSPQIRLPGGMSSFSEAVSLCTARRNTCAGISRQSSFSDIASMFSIDAGEVAERLKQTISTPTSEYSEEFSLPSITATTTTHLQLPDSVKRTLRQCKQAFSRDVNLDSIWTYAKERFGANVDYSSSGVSSSSDAILNDIIRRGPEAFSDLLEQLDRMSASERAIGELFSAVDSLLRCFYGEDTSRAWIDSRYTPTPITCKNCVAGVAGVAGVAAALDDFPDDGFSGDVGVTCVTGGGNYDRHDECVDISLSYRDTDTGRQVNADDLPEPTSLERRLYKQRYRPQVSLSLYETCLADRRRFLGLQCFLERYDCLIQLSLVKCHFAPMCLSDLTSQLVRTHGLRVLDFKMIDIDDLSAGFLADALASGSSSLKSLNIISASLHDSRYLHILNDVGNCRTLKELDISFNSISIDGCEIIARHLAINLPLQKLRVRNNNITSHGAAILFDSLHHNTSLKELDLSCNNIGSLSTLAHSLRNNDTIRVLCLEECGLSDDSCKELSILLNNRLCAIEVLDLNMNPIGNEGISELSRAISRNKVITTLSLNQCRISNAGAAAMFTMMLEYHTSLVYLKLAFNRLHSEGSSSPASLSSISSANSATASRSSPSPSSGDSQPDIVDLIDRVNRKYGSLKLHLFGNRL